MRHAFTALACLVLVGTVAAPIAMEQDPQDTQTAATGTQTPRTMRPVITGRQYAVSTMKPQATEAAVRILEAGGHVAMLVDQYYVQGVDVTFFGRKTKANPLLARLARHVDCPIHGVRMIRLPDHRFRIEVTDAIAPARDADGNIDVQGTMQIITNVVEAWVREHPEQWLWLHKRWR